MNAPLKLNEAKVGMFVRLNVADSKSSYVRNLHGCRSQIEKIGYSKIQVRVTDKSGNVEWLEVSPQKLIRKYL